MNIVQIDAEYKRKFNELVIQLGRQPKFMETVALSDWYKQQVQPVETITDATGAVVEKQWVGGVQQETLTCMVCGNKFTREIKRGRKPKECEVCR